MNTKYNNVSKTLGPRAAQVFTELNQRRRAVFTLSDVTDITGLSRVAASNLIAQLHRHGVVTRLKPGLYNLVPFELGWSREHIESPYLIAREMAGSAPHFLSHGTAFELHRLVTQPNFTIYLSCTHRLRAQSIAGYDFHFVHVKPEHVFGLTKHWVDKERFVMITDLEHTIIDALKQPAYVGGITEAAKGMWMRREQLNVEQLVSYALRLRNGAVLRRLGYLLELYGLAEAPQLARLSSQLTMTNQRLDPTLPAEGKILTRWRVQLNVTPEELQAVRYG